MLTPAILAAAIYNFMTHLESLEIPLVIGLPARIFVFPSFIYFSTQRFSPPQYGIAAALGVVFVLVSILLIWWYRRVTSRAGKYATVTGKGYRPRIIRLGKWRYPAFGLFVAFFLLIIAAPTFILLWTSFMPTYIPPTSPDVLERLTFKNYIAIFNNPSIAHAVVNTLYVAIGAATLTMGLSLLMAWVTVRAKIPGRGTLDVVTFLPHALPGVIIGISFIFLFVQPPLSYLQLYGSLTLIILAMTVSYISFGSRTMNSALTQIHTEMEEAGRASGVRWRTIMRRIVLPLLFPAFASGFIWVASHSLRNFSIPIMLAGRDTEVISVVMWESWDDGKPGETCALGVLLILVLGTFTIAGRSLVAKLNPQQQT
jgi:iron(III) transport system permease protein